MARVLGFRVQVTNYASATRQILDWASHTSGHIVYMANVHMLMEAFDDRDFRRILETADLVLPDGMPLVWMLRMKGYQKAERVYGPDLMLRSLLGAADENLPVGFLGSTDEVLRALKEKLRVRFPSLNEVFSYSPPFREMSKDEDSKIVEQIGNSGARILFVGLGCPKQEIWMAEHRGKVNAVMLGVGAAFDFHAGVKPQAPAWMQKSGLEWLFRLLTEPRRLWRRYLYHNPRFIFLAIADLLGFLR